MKKAAVFLILISFFPLSIFLVMKSYAETTIRISNNGDGSSSHVSVNSSLSTTSNSKTTTSSNGHTSVRIESNGEVKTYESDDNGPVHIESSDGRNRVDINNKSNLGSSQSNSSDIQRKKTDLKQKLEDKRAEIKTTITSIPHPSVTKSQALRFDLGLWIRSLFASIFK